MRDDQLDLFPKTKPEPIDWNKMYPESPRQKKIREYGERAKREIPKYLHHGDVRFKTTRSERLLDQWVSREIELTGWINGVSGMGAGDTYQPTCIILVHNPEYVAGKKGSELYRETLWIRPDRIIARRDPKTDQYLPIEEWAEREKQNG